VNDYIKIYTFGDTQTITTGQSIILQYNAPTTFSPSLASLNDSSFFSGMTLFNSFDEYSVSDNSIFAEKNKVFEYAYLKKEISNAKEITFTSYEDLKSTLRDKVFRITNWNALDSKLIIYTNCVINSGYSNSYNLTLNDIVYTVTFEEEIIKTTWT
jgi:hypothetical protein